MAQSNYRSDIIPQDTGEDDSSLEAETAQPLSEAEIEDLLYGGGRSTSERLALLRAFRDDLTERSDGARVADDDPEALIAEVNKRIAELEEDADADGVVFDVDPLAHRETLAPDSDELEALEAEDEDSLDEEDEWLDEEEKAKGDASSYDEAVEEDLEDDEE